MINYQSPIANNEMRLRIYEIDYLAHVSFESEVLRAGRVRPAAFRVVASGITAAKQTINANLINRDPALMGAPLPAAVYCRAQALMRDHPEEGDTRTEVLFSRDLADFGMQVHKRALFRFLDG